MPKIDLITGFLGSGKTTFLRKYAEYLLAKGQYIGILENDYGAVNVDMMLLADLEGDKCELEMVSGGCDYDCHRRRFKTKLITMGMYGYDRVLVEPSGVFDVDEFFDVLCEEPLDGWYEIGNVITVVNASLEEELSDQSEYLLAAQAAKSGQIVLSKSDAATDAERERTVAHLNRALAKFGCKRDISDIITCEELPSIPDEVLENLSKCGYTKADHIKIPVMETGTFSSLYYMNRGFRPEEALTLVHQTFVDSGTGGLSTFVDSGTGGLSTSTSTSASGVFRVKGFLKDGEQWMELNATRDGISLSPIPAGQDVMIIIGEDLNREELCKIWGTEGLA